MDRPPDAAGLAPRAASPAQPALARRTLLAAVWSGAALAAGCHPPPEPATLTFAGSVVGREGRIISRQITRFQEFRPDLHVEVRATPDAADTRRQLYVQWLNAHSSEPDVLQLDIIWTAEFAGAGWIRPLDELAQDTGDFFPATIVADRWQGRLYALPWFVDVGMLYWRTDLWLDPPEDFTELISRAANAPTRTGLVWQGARYEGLVTVFLEHLGAFGGRILDGEGRVVVDSPAAIRALEAMRDAIHRQQAVPEDVLGWQEEQVRFAFQNGTAAFMRNWPYAIPLLQDAGSSEVAGRFAVAPMPAGPGGAPVAALGGSQLAINAHSAQPENAAALVEFLLAPDQMIERAAISGQWPSRPSLYDASRLGDTLGVPPAAALQIVEAAVPRPVTPVYSELSELLQVQLHRALTRQVEPAEALTVAAAEIRALLARAGLAPRGSS